MKYIDDIFGLYTYPNPPKSGCIAACTYAYTLNISIFNDSSNPSLAEPSGNKIPRAGGVKKLLVL